MSEYHEGYGDGQAAAMEQMHERMKVHQIIGRTPTADYVLAVIDARWTLDGLEAITEIPVLTNKIEDIATLRESVEFGLAALYGSDGDKKGAIKSLEKALLDTILTRQTDD